jgi:hypothetical protein
MIYSKNLPLWERALRILAGCAIIGGAWLAAPSTLILAVAIAVGAGLIATSLLGFCPGCAMVGRRPIQS